MFYNSKTHAQCYILKQHWHTLQTGEDISLGYLRISHVIQEAEGCSG